MATRLLVVSIAFLIHCCFVLFAVGVTHSRQPEHTATHSRILFSSGRANWHFMRSSGAFAGVWRNFGIVPPIWGRLRSRCGWGACRRDVQTYSLEPPFLIQPRPLFRNVRVRRGAFKTSLVVRFEKFSFENKKNSRPSSADR